MKHCDTCTCDRKPLVSPEEQARMADLARKNLAHVQQKRREDTA